jgi:predicted cupin superfamily sugar epimerase
MTDPDPALKDPQEVERIIEHLGLSPHPEGGFYRETWRSPHEDGNGRSLGTAIHFLLPRGASSHWHRIDADEIWHHYRGAPVELAFSRDGLERRAVVLGPDLLAGQHPQWIVPAGTWFAARPLGGWALCGCTVAPGFEFAGFELAPPGWSPGAA